MMNVNLLILFATLALAIICLQINFTTMLNIHDNVGKLFSRNVEPASLELFFMFYIILVPISFNTLVICALGKYTLESRRSMTRCYVYSIVSVVLAFMLSYLQCSIYANVVTGSLLLFNAIESGTLLLTNLAFTLLLLKSEITELKRITKVKRLGMCLISPNLRVFILIGLYFFWLGWIVIDMWHTALGLGLSPARIVLASTLFSTNSSVLINYLYNLKTRL